MTISRYTVLAVMTSATADAATFPADSAFVPLACDGGPMTDLFQDQSGALNERDIVGDSTAPAGLRAADDEFLYLRLRLDKDPAPGGAARPFSWGMELDLDGNFTTYELLILVDGTGGGAGMVALYRNQTTTLANDPADPADQPPVATFPFAMNARSVVAPGSSFGGDADFFLDFAMPWSELIPLGLDRDTTTSVWAASSSSANSLNADFACHDGRTGSPTLDSVVSDPTTGDPTQDPNPPPNPPPNGAGRLEGGGGCAATGGAVFGGFPFVAIALLVYTRRRRTESTSRAR